MYQIEVRVGEITIMLTRLLSVTLVALSSTIAIAASADTNATDSTTEGPVVKVSPTDPNIRYTGRWNFDDPEVPWVVWTGASIKVKFQGTGIAIEIDPRGETEQYRVVIDGVPEKDRRHFSPGKETYELAAGLSDGPHTLELMKETLKSYRSLFHGFIVRGTGLLPLPPRPALRIEFFGDSNMMGYSNYSEKDERVVGTYYAFPAMITRMLGAEMHNQSRGGASIADEGDNHVKFFVYAQEYTQEPGNRGPHSVYQSDFAPHIIVIGAGGNDTSFGRSKTIVKKRYKSVIAELRKVYGADPKIILFNSYGWGVEEPARYTHEVVEELGDPNVSACVFPWLTDSGHSSQWGHSGQAHILVDHIAGLNPDWAPINTPDIADGFGRDWDFANGSFEHQAPFGGYGWPYSEDGVERLHDTAGAADGDYYIRLEEGEQVQQITDATGDLNPNGTTGTQTYYIRAKIRGVSEGAQAQITTEFQDKKWIKHGKPKATTFRLTTSWQAYTATATAPDDTWTLINTLRASAGTVEFDDIRMSNTKFELAE
jgi:hypothetical protein